MKGKKETEELARGAVFCYEDVYPLTEDAVKVGSAPSLEPSLLPLRRQLYALAVEYLAHFISHDIGMRPYQNSPFRNLRVPSRACTATGAIWK
jgi:hypothetical protein